MRRKRRQSTQIIRKKSSQNSSAGSIYSSPPKSGRGRKILLTIATIIIVVFAIYYIYSIAGPDEHTTIPDVSEAKTEISVEDKTEEIPEIAPLEHKIQIEILNGCGVNGVAKLFQSKLREHNFDVANTENYIVDGKINWKVKNTFIIDQIGVTEQAKAVAKALGLVVTKIESRENPTALYDVSVVIGKDYKQLLSE